MPDIHPSVTTWLDYLDQQGKSQATVENYRRALIHFIAWSERSY